MAAGLGLGWGWAGAGLELGWSWAGQWSVIKYLSAPLSTFLARLQHKAGPYKEFMDPAPAPPAAGLTI